MTGFEAGNVPAEASAGPSGHLWSGSTDEPFNDHRLFVYCIDRDDRLCYMNRACEHFAMENGAPELTAGNLVGTSIWDYITGPDVQAMYQTLFNHVRTHQQPSRFPFRCDSPERCRLMHMQLKPLGDLGVELCCSVIAMRPRPKDENNQRDHERIRHPLNVCSLCNRARSEPGPWLEPDAALAEQYLARQSLSPPINHVLCDDCKAQLQ